jgi:hypothetical protein
MILSLQPTHTHPVYLAMKKSRKQRVKFQPKKGKQVHPTPNHTENSNFSLLYYRQRGDYMLEDLCTRKKQSCGLKSNLL